MRQQIGWLLLLVLALCSSSCALVTRASEHWVRVPKTCPDGIPPKVLTSPACAHGVCGYSCLPGRWAVLSGS
jgi:hypothetical protein